MIRLYVREKMKSTLYRIAANAMPKIQTPMQQVFYSYSIKDNEPAYRIPAYVPCYPFSD